MSKAKVVKAHAKTHGIKVINARLTKNPVEGWKGIPQVVSGRIKWVEGSK